MSTSPSSCGMCDNRHISKPSEVWCPDCEERLCTECIEYQKLPSYLLKIEEHCSEHQEKFNFIL
jgi:hypothetical protein